MSPPPPPPDPAPPPPPQSWQRWLRDAFTAAGGFWAWGGLVVLLVGLLASLFLPALGRLKSTLATSEVVAYIAQDVTYADPLLAEFTRQTGIRVRTVYDSEAVKTVGLANRLLAERARPQCDVFWGNEELRTRQLAAQQVWRETNGWAAFGYRSRRLMIHTGFVSADLRPEDLAPQLSELEPPTSSGGLLPAPRSLHDLTNAVWRGKVALAYPLFGTTPTHLLALRQHWGEARWETWCQALAANQPFIVDGNSVVARLVARGEAWVGLTDSDDIRVVLDQGAPVMALPLDDETLLIPNTVGVTRRAPRPEAAQRLFAYLQSAAVAEQLVRLGALEGVQVSAVDRLTLTPDWDALLAELETGTARLKSLFVR